MLLPVTSPTPEPVKPPLRPAQSAAAVPPTASVAPSSLFSVGGIVLAIGVLYFGRDIFIPFALAIMLSFALAPPVNWLRRLKLPRVAAVLLTVMFAFAAIGGISAVVGSQLVQLAENLPTYQETIRNKIRTLRSSSQDGGMVDRVTTAIKDLSKELSTPDKPADPQASSLDAGKAPRPPVRVTIEQPAAQPLEIIQTVVGPASRPACNGRHRHHFRDLRSARTQRP